MASFFVVNFNYILEVINGANGLTDYSNILFSYKKYLEYE